MRREELHGLDWVVKWGWLVSGVVHVILTLTMARTLAPAPGRPAGEQLLELTFNPQQDELEALEQVDAPEFELIDGRKTTPMPTHWSNPYSPAPRTRSFPTRVHRRRSP